MLFGLVASAKRNQVEPYARLRDLFERLPTLTTGQRISAAEPPKGTHEPLPSTTASGARATEPHGSATEPGGATEPNPLDDLLPDRWLATHPEHRWHLDETRCRERRQPGERREPSPSRPR